MVRALLRKLLQRYAQVRTDREAMHGPAEQMSLVNDLVLLQNGLGLGAFLRGERMVGFCAT
jgi:hypothetical protein